MKRLLYDNIVGPFKTTAYQFVVQSDFDPGEEAIWLYLDEGPEFDLSLLSSDQAFAFKIPAGTIWRLKIHGVQGALEHTFAQVVPIPVVGQKSSRNAAIQLLDSLPDTMTDGSGCVGYCGGVIPCPPPAIKLSCTDPANPVCVRPGG